MTIYAIVNTKGGVAKTTTAVHLATKLSESGSVLLIDGDSQASAASWAAWRREANYKPSPTTTCLSGKAILTEGKELAKNYDNTVVDVGGRDSVGLRSALLLAQKAIVPIGASNLDAAALTDLMTIIDLAKDHNKNLDVKLLLSRVDPRTKDVNEMVQFLREQNLPLMHAKICERVAFRRAIGEGLTVKEIRKDQTAIDEINAFVGEIQGGKQ